MAVKNKLGLIEPRMMSEELDVVGSSSSWVEGGKEKNLFVLGMPSEVSVGLKKGEDIAMYPGESNKGELLVLNNSLAQVPESMDEEVGLLGPKCSP